MDTANDTKQPEPAQALTTPPGSRFNYDTESGFIFDQRSGEWLTDMVETWELLDEYDKRGFGLGSCDPLGGISRPLPSR